MGRQRGQLVRCACTQCGEVEMRPGCSSGFQCRTCKPIQYGDTQQQRAHSAVRQAVSSGLLAPISACKCVDCGELAEHYDHRDYGRPLEVEPVCRPCNYRRGPAIGSPAMREFA